MHLGRPSSHVPRLSSCLKVLQNPHIWLIFVKVQNPLRLPLIMTIRRPKVVRTRCVFNMVPSKCASRHNGVLFSDISTSKTALRLVCFDHFDIAMCLCVFRILTWMRFAPQSHLTRWLRPRRFSGPIFRPSQKQLWSSFFHLSLPWSSAFLFSDSSTSVAPSVHKSEVWLLNFLRQSC